MKSIIGARWIGPYSVAYYMWRHPHGPLLRKNERGVPEIVRYADDEGPDRLPAFVAWEPGRPEPPEEPRRFFEGPDYEAFDPDEDMEHDDVRRRPEGQRYWRTA